MTQKLMIYGNIFQTKLKSFKKKEKCQEKTWAKTCFHCIKWTQHLILTYQLVLSLNQNMKSWDKNIKNWIQFSRSKFKTSLKTIHQSKVWRVYKNWWLWQIQMKDKLNWSTFLVGLELENCHKEQTTLPVVKRQKLNKKKI